MALNWYSFKPLACQKPLAPWQYRLKQNFFLDYAILTEYLASAVTLKSSNPYVGTSPRTKKIFFLLSASVDEILLSP